MRLPALTTSWLAPDTASRAKSHRFIHTPSDIRSPSGRSDDGSDALVIVAIPTYNRSAALRRAIESVLDQDHGRVTALISDDASWDDTEAVCRDLASRDARVVYHRQPKNLGLTANYNWLARAALEFDPRRAGFFMFLSDDDWLDRDYCTRCLTRLGSDPQLSLVGGRTRLHTRDHEVGDDPDVNLLSPSGTQRVWDFCHAVLPTGVFAGVMPMRIVARLPLQRNVLGHDWLLLVNVAYLGKVATEPATTVHRGVDGVSSSAVRLAATLRVSRLQAVRPLATIALFMTIECLYRSPVFARLPIHRRVRLAAVMAAALAARRLTPALERKPQRARNRVALKMVRGLRTASAKLDDAALVTAPRAAVSGQLPDGDSAPGAL